MPKMPRTLLTILVIGLLLSPASGAVQHTNAQSRERYFPETGHSVSGLFLDFYESAPDPLLVYGYPITERFRDGVTNQYVQYFQRARFELQESATGRMKVRLSDLGELLYEADSPGEPLPLPTTANCRSFPQADYPVCYAFLDFFESHGGLAQFGLPISPFEYHDGIMVQYFDRARFEWRPERPAGQKVVLSQLGRMWFDERREDKTLREPVGYNIHDVPVLDLRTRAFPLRAVTGMHGEQTVYVIVLDQNLQPVNGAQVTLTLRMPDGDEVGGYILPLTDENGITQKAFAFESSQRGVALVHVDVAYGSMEPRTTVTSFRLWW